MYRVQFLRATLHGKSEHSGGTWLGILLPFCRLFSCSSRVKIPIYLQVLLSHRLCSVWVLSRQHGSGLYTVQFAA